MPLNIGLRCVFTLLSSGDSALMTQPIVWWIPVVEFSENMTVYKEEAASCELLA